MKPQRGQFDTPSAQLRVRTMKKDCTKHQQKLNLKRDSPLR